MRRLLVISGLIITLITAQAAFAKKPSDAPELMPPPISEAQQNAIPLTEEEQNGLIDSLDVAVINGPIIIPMSLSSGCNTTSFPGILWVPYGNVCYVQNSSYTYNQIWVQGAMVVGGTTSTTTLTANGGDIYVYGTNALVIVGWTTGSTGKDASLRTYGSTSYDLHIYSGGKVYTRGNTYSGIDHYLNISGTLDVGGSTTDGDLDIQDNYNYNRTYKLKVNNGGDLDIDAGRLDVSYITYVNGSNGRIDIDSGTELETNYLYAGEVDGSPVGGIINNDGILDVVYTATLYDGADLYCDGTCYARHINMMDGSQITNNGTFYQDSSSSAVRMFDDSTLTNNNNFFINGDLIMEENATSSSPSVYNYEYLQIYDDLITKDNSAISNATSGTSYAFIDVRDDVYMYDSSDIINYSNFKQGYDSANTSSTLMHMEDSATFRNGDSSSLYWNDDDASVAYGWVKILNNAVFENNGSAEIHELYLGDESLNITGGTFNNKADAELWIFNSVSGDPTYTAVDIYGGLLDNKAYSDEFYIGGDVEISGTSTKEGELKNQHDYETSDYEPKIGPTTINDYGVLSNTGYLKISERFGTTGGDLVLNNNAELDNDDILSVGNTITTNNTSFIDNDGNLYSVGEVIMNDNSTLYNYDDCQIKALIMNGYAYAENNRYFVAREDVIMRGSTRIDNNSSMNIYDDLIMSNEESGGTASFYNDGVLTTLSLLHSDDNLIHAANGAYIENTDGALIRVNSDSGIINVIEDAKIVNNVSTIQAWEIDVGYGTMEGGEITNVIGGSTIELGSGAADAMNIYRGLVTNYLSSSIEGDENCGITIDGISSDKGYLYNTGDISCEVIEGTYGEYMDS